MKTYTCDIKNREHIGAVHTKKVSVIFDHDQEDGKSKMKPYIESYDLDMCDGCVAFMLENRRYIYGYGAMGYNTYTLTN